jgi:hypothetical protein
VAPGGLCDGEAPAAEVVVPLAVPSVAVRGSVQQAQRHVVLAADVLHTDIPGTQQAAEVVPNVHELLAGQLLVPGIDAQEVAEAAHVQQAVQVVRLGVEHAGWGRVEIGLVVTSICDRPLNERDGLSCCLALNDGWNR